MSKRDPPASVDYVSLDEGKVMILRAQAAHIFRREASGKKLNFSDPPNIF
jgi:hypothetical protein